MPKLDAIHPADAWREFIEHGDGSAMPTFVQEDTRVLASRIPKLTPEQEAANEAEHKIKRGEMPKW